MRKSKRAKKRKNFDGTTLICCAIGMAFSISIFTSPSKKENARAVAQHAQMATKVQSQSIQELLEIEMATSSFEEISQVLLKRKQKIAPIGNKESEDSFNAQYEAKLAEQLAKENEDSVNAEFEAELAKQLQNADASIDDAELEDENSNFTSEKHNSYSESDYELLCEITYAEAGNQTMEQQIAAAATILNRVESEIFPNTIKGVIMQHGQFASTRNGHIYACGEIVDFSNVPEESKEAARKALAGEDPTENWLRKEAKRLGLSSEKYASGGALYFYSPEFTSSSELAARANIKCKVQNGGHTFYKVWG